MFDAGGQLDVGDEGGRLVLAPRTTITEVAVKPVPMTRTTKDGSPIAAEGGRSCVTTGGGGASTSSLRATARPPGPGPRLGSGFGPVSAGLRRLRLGQIVIGTLVGRAVVARQVVVGTRVARAIGLLDSGASVSWP